tara:strand:+ start:120 stop:329 length:210 start_codon:yes stop_codon:yes gene_type:complete
MLNLKPKDFIRKGEKEFAKLNLANHLDNDILLYEAMSANPKLIERPIIISDTSAVIGRPPENVLKLLAS